MAPYYSYCYGSVMLLYRRCFYFVTKDIVCKFLIEDTKYMQEEVCKIVSAVIRNFLTGI